MNKQWAKMKNVAGEIMGIIKAIQVANEIKINSLLIYHDYIELATWTDDKCNDKEPETIAYQNFIMANRENMIIEFAKIKTHKKVKYNKHADKLAKEAYSLVSFASVELDLKQSNNLQKPTLQNKANLSPIEPKVAINPANNLSEPKKELDNATLQLKMLMNGNEHN